MKKIVFSEGKYDVHFIDKLFDNSSANPSVDKFVVENESRSDLKNKESEKIRNFLERFNPYDVLIKSENGKPNLKHGFVSVLRQLANEEVEKYVLVDLDNRSIHDFLTDIEEQMNQRFSGCGLRLGNRSIIKENRHMIAQEIELQIDTGRDPRTGFVVVAFKTSLETVADIGDGDGHSEKTTKIESILDIRPVSRLLQTTFL
ncbi:hypothetical protein [Haladaptatus cibarius]|uniref:hypothetical protein n=1 Tax=Haladaptatus cibarius TaxID=453847 RepID=UPI000679C976|nr:hypothetical protein [Haladaptatus cibarius]